MAASHAHHTTRLMALSNIIKSAPLHLIATGLTILLLWSLVILKISSDHKIAEASVRTGLQNVVLGVKEHTQDNLHAADEALRMLKFHYEANGLNDMGLLNRYFQQHAVDISALNQVGIIDAHGIYVFSSLPNQNRIDLSDREHFKVHQQAYPYPLFVSKPVIGRASGKWSFQMTRRIDDRNGKFNGVATASLNPNHFLDRFSQIQLGPDSLIGLVGMDGYARAMRVGDVIRADDNLRNLELPPHVKEADSGYFYSDQFFDNTQRIFVFTRLHDLPLFAIVGMRVDEAFQEFQRQKNILIAAAWALSLLIVLLAWRKHHAIQHQEEMRVELFDHHRLMQQIDDIQRACEQKVAVLDGEASIGRRARDAAAQCQSCIDAVHTSVDRLEAKRNTVERLIQAFFRLQMAQINSDEFIVLIQRLHPEIVLERMTDQLQQARANLRQLDDALSAFKSN